ncbi:outer membrane beta-barrel protein [Sphingobacterium spiritivorum]|uniref:outer membrane beta-barrel protein n=1 Tax=Sphingobacterium spiritivorum TaxID=258 RepID=UPI003DA48FCF
MIKYLTLLCFIICCSTHLYAQHNTVVAGEVIDIKDKAKLEKASVVLLRSRDSVMQSFARTGENGKFSITSKDTGEYLLIINYPQYADFVKKVHIQDRSIDIGLVNMSKTAILLEEARVTGRIPVLIKGDTIEYDAASFKVEEGSKVESLLRVLPGITVNADGTITAQGKTVKKVLLDGEEFFGDDPTLITKNIRSDMVSKVQVYEKKSEMATRTGVDDGERTQTIDIRLKEDSKRGVFGDLNAGIGSKGFYSGSLTLNKFKGLQKIGVFGNAGNDGAMDLGYFTNQSFEEISLAGASNGIPTVINSGITYSDKSSNNKHKINSNYKYSRLQLDNTNTTFSRDELPGFSKIENNKAKTSNLNNGHQAGLRYDLELDSSSNITFNLGYKLSKTENTSFSEGLEQTLDYEPINKTEGSSLDNNTNQNAGLSVYYTKKLRKTGRSFTMQIASKITDQKSRNQYFSSVEYVKLDSVNVIDQLKQNTENDNRLTSSFNYSEPLSKSLTASLGYEYVWSQSKTLEQSFNKDPLTQQYTEPDISVLNNLSYRNYLNTGSFDLNYVKDKFTININNKLISSVNVRNDHGDNSLLDIKQLSYNPIVNINFYLNQYKSLRFSYAGNTVLPTLSQIRPLRQNTDQRTRFLPNENLNGGYRNSLNISYNSYRLLKQQYININAIVGNEVDNITSFITVNPATGQRTLQYINISDKQNINASINGTFSFVLSKKSDLRAFAGLSTSYSGNYNYVNTTASTPELNLSKQISYFINFGLQKWSETGFNFHANLSPGFSKMNSSVQPNLNNNAFTFNNYSSFAYIFPHDFKLNIEINQNYQAATGVYAKPIHNMYVNSYVSKKFLKDKSLETRISVNDLLNERNGIKRNQDGTRFTETQNNVINRFFMFKVIYNFTSMKGGGQSEG